MKSDEKLLRETVRSILEEEWADYGGVTPWTVPGMGGGVKGSKSSIGFGTPGNSLYSIFIDPFVNAAKVIGAEVGQTGVRLVALLHTVLEAALSVLLPKFQADYDKISKQQKAQIDKIREHYKSSYEAMDDAWNHPDIQLFSFLHDPSTWLSYKMITAKPQAVLSVYDTIAEGNQSLLLYLRDIRNRMYGTSTPGGSLPMAQPSSHHEAAAPTPKKKTKGELIADALTSPQFIEMVNALPLVQQMKKDAASIDQQTTSQLTQAMQPVLNADTAEDLAHASGGAWQVPQELSKLEPGEKSDLEGPLVDQTKASMKAFYASRAEEQLAQATSLGVASNSPYVSSLKALLQSLK